MSVIDRRRFIYGAAAGGLGLGATASATFAATDDELAVANFCLAGEFLLKDFYARAADADLFDDESGDNMRAGGRSATEHAAALAQLLDDAGQSPAVEEDFEFAWPEGTFDSKQAAARAGLTAARTLLGVCQSAAAAISVQSYRVLYVSLTASLAQQVAALANVLTGRGTGVSFPAALELEAASAALEDVLG